MSAAAITVTDTISIADIVFTALRPCLPSRLGYLSDLARGPARPSVGFRPNHGRDAPSLPSRGHVSSRAIHCTCDRDGAPGLPHGRTDFCGWPVCVSRKGSLPVLHSGSHTHSLASDVTSLSVPLETPPPSSVTEVVSGHLQQGVGLSALLRHSTRCGCMWFEAVLLGEYKLKLLLPSREIRNYCRGSMSVRALFGVTQCYGA